MTISYQPSVRALAQAGDLKAIAYWLNGFLAPQGIQVRVGRSRVGLHLLIEFQRQPNRDRLVRFVCNRLCQLRSNLIGKVCIAARPVGSRKIIWSQSVRLAARPRSAPGTVSRQIKPPTLQPAPSATTSAIVLRQTPSFTIAQRNRRRRAIVLGSSAAAAFVVGGGFELMQHYSASTTGRNGARSETVTTADDRVTVTEHTAQNPLDPTVTLTFSSDLIAPRAEASAFSNMRSDIALANLDAPNESATVAPLSVEHVDLVNLASDRLKGRAIEQTIDQLNEAGIGSIGAGRNRREARRPQILEVKGQRIAYLGYSDSDLQVAGSWNAGLNPAIDRRIREDIQAIRPQVDWVVVNYCWNQDLAEYPDDNQVKLARFAIDEGADLVVGHHPNVLQGAEIYKGRAIAYSIGNFVFADSQTNSETDYDTAVLKVSLRESNSSATKQMRVEFVPIQVRQSQPAIAVGENARRITQYMRQASGLFEKPLQSPTILDLRSADAPTSVPQPSGYEPPAIESPAIELSPANPVPTAPVIESPDAPASPSDSFIAPPDAPAAQPNSFTPDPLPSTRTREIRQDQVKPPAAQTADDRHLAPPSAEPTRYQAPAESIEPAPAASPKPIPIEVTIDSVASLPDAPKPAIESPKPIEAALAEAAPTTEIAPAPQPATASEESAEPEAN
ncbi:CapA family protein [Microcoleus sp. FACHB-1515]|uniref:CapA family protein n=1 Tax=Cyanophyceae TaxID=3028117 RepID=UPI0016884631|nr:CapA family protein [Microcoleus sp. FACHB-1515]MBD2093073.1 CapA family protein [Microcoleus sp. FACHB-1515]